ncbi:unnamed protein product [Absidia cylindrospora]
MTTRPSKKQRLMDSSTTSTLPFTEQHQANDNCPRRIRKRRQIKKITISFESDSDDNDDQWEASHLVDFEYSKRDIHEILDYTGNTIEHQPDGSVIITPHPRHLPTEIISIIAQHVAKQIDSTHGYFPMEDRLASQRDFYQFTLVNQQFYSVFHPILWRAPELETSVRLDRFQTCLVEAQQPWKLGWLIQDLQLTGNHWTSVRLSLLLPYLRHLKSFGISAPPPTLTDNCMKIDPECLALLPRHCPNLHTLNLYHVDLLESTIKALNQHTRQLRSLSLRQYLTLPSSLFDKLNACPLETVVINTRRLKESMVRSMMRMPKLTFLVLIGDHPTLATTFFATANKKAATRAAAAAAAAATTTHGGDLVASDRINNLYLSPFPHLTTFYFHSNSTNNSMTDVLLAPFLKWHPQLRVLDLNGGNYSDSTLETMALCLPHLETVQLAHNRNITAAGVRKLVQTARQLIWVSVIDCPLIKPSNFPEASPHRTSPFQADNIVVLGLLALNKIQLAAATAAAAAAGQ